MKKITLNIVKTYGKSFDCETCGSCYPEGLFLQYDGETIWEKYSDGHCSGHMTQESILNKILEKWGRDNFVRIKAESSEKNRLQWNLDHPGNGIAASPQSWSEYHASQKNYIMDTQETMREYCENIPHDEVRQIRMIALWLEDVTGEDITIHISSKKLY